MRTVVRLFSWALAGYAITACSSGEIGIGVRDFLQGQQHGQGPGASTAQGGYSGDEGFGGAAGEETGTPGQATGAAGEAAGGVNAAPSPVVEAGVATGMGGGSSLPTDSIPLQAGRYSQGEYSGGLWTAVDSGGSEIQPPCGAGGVNACFVDRACVSGVVAKVEVVDGGYDWAGTWGAMIGWNLAQAADGMVGVADVSGKTLLVVGLSGAAGLYARVNLTVPDGTIYCKDLSLVDGGAEVRLVDLRTECWMTGGVSFDPTAMRPSAASIHFPATNRNSTVFDDVCVTKLAIE